MNFLTKLRTARLKFKRSLEISENVEFSWKESSTILGTQEFLENFGEFKEK